MSIDIFSYFSSWFGRSIWKRIIEFENNEILFQLENIMKKVEKK